MNEPELKKLRDLLLREAVKPRLVDRFDILLWYLAPSDAANPACGTTACACGTAALSGLFNGFSLEGADIMYERENGETLYGFRAAEEYFDLTHDEARFLFSPGYYADKAGVGRCGELEVAQRIDDFIKHGHRSALERARERRTLSYSTAHPSFLEALEERGMR